jgi:hypothetical protein
MAVTIDGTNGINDIVLGSSTPAAATVTTFTSNGIDDNANAVAITIDSSENVGIGTASPATYGTLAVRLSTSTSVPVLGMSVTGSSPLLNHYITDSGSTVRTLNQIVFGTGSTSSANYQGYLAFKTASAAAVPAEHMRISSAGQVFINCTAAPSDSVAGVRLGNPAVALCAFSCGSLTTEVYQLGFYNGNGLVGRISTSGSATSYTTSSDYRLKENVVYDWDATTRLKQLKPARFNFIGDADRTVDGFLAHEAEAVVPEAISGAKDAMTTEVLYVEGDELPDGKSVGDVKEASVPDYQGIDQSKLVPLLVKTIQELEARITALEG